MLPFFDSLHWNYTLIYFYLICHVLFILSLCLAPHYCYYCSTSLSDVEPAVQRQIMTQRLFHYPREAIKSRCQEPFLSRAGGLQICSSDEPMCASINAKTENNVNFTVLGCVDSILRPSMKLPVKGDDQCTTLEIAGLDFTLCYCSTSLCNIGINGHALTSVMSSSSKPITKVYKANFTSSKEADLIERFHYGGKRKSAVHITKVINVLLMVLTKFIFKE